MIEIEVGENWYINFSMDTWRLECHQVVVFYGLKRSLTGKIISTLIVTLEQKRKILYLYKFIEQ